MIVCWVQFYFPAKALLTDRLVTCGQEGAVHGNRRNPLHSDLEFQLTRVVEAIRPLFAPSHHLFSSKYALGTNSKIPKERQVALPDNKQ